VAGPLKEYKDLIFNHDLKPRNSGEYFAAYLALHCVQFREKAIQQIAQLGTVRIGEEYKKSCMKQTDSLIEGPELQLEVVDLSSRTEWKEDVEIYSHCKFAIVLENFYRDGYITENILIAWLGGAVPIWYGTHDIFNMFNEKAFIYYDVEDPEAALEQIEYLNKNPEAYEALLNEPILKDGQNTIDKHFSLLDGELRDHIRSKILVSKMS